MEWFNCKVDDRSKVLGGAQRIETSDGYVIPLSIESGLDYMHSITIPDNDHQQYPHVFFTSPDTCNLSVLDHGITPSRLEEINEDNDHSLLQDSMFDKYGELQHRAVQKLNICWDPHPTESGEHTFHTQLHESYHVGSPQVSFLMCTLEIPQKNCSTSSLLLTLFTFTFEPFLKL